MKDPYTGELSVARAIAGAIYLYEIEQENLGLAVAALTDAQKAFEMVNPEGPNVYMTCLEPLTNQLRECESRLSSLANQMESCGMVIA